MLTNDLKSYYILNKSAFGLSRKKKKKKKINLIII